jgi:hypothetical protein
MKKRGQMKMSFGMIFSIILIIAFLAFAFYAIRNFLGMQQEVQINQFKENLQNDVDRLWKSTSGSKPVEYPLPSRIEGVCFYMDDLGIYNMLLQEEKIFTEHKIKNIDIPRTVGDNSEVCKEVIDGKISFKLEKDSSNPLVRIVMDN